MPLVLLMLGTLIVGGAVAAFALVDDVAPLEEEIPIPGPGASVEGLGPGGAKVTVNNEAVQGGLGVNVGPIGISVPKWVRDDVANAWTGATSSVKDVLDDTLGIGGHAAQRHTEFAQARVAVRDVLVKELQRMWAQAARPGCLSWDLQAPQGLRCLATAATKAPTWWETGEVGPADAPAGSRWYWARRFDATDWPGALGKEHLESMRVEFALRAAWAARGVRDPSSLWGYGLHGLVCPLYPDPNEEGYSRENYAADTKLMVTAFQADTARNMAKQARQS